MLSQEYTEARREARELAAKSDFYHRLAHDLLTPLTVVSTDIQTAAMFSEEAPECLENAQAEIMAVARQLNEALEEKWRQEGDL